MHGDSVAVGVGRWNHLIHSMVEHVRSVVVHVLSRLIVPCVGAWSVVVDLSRLDLGGIASRTTSRVFLWFDPKLRPMKPEL